MEWLLDNPPIYNHGSAYFKGREVKADLITEKAEKMGCTYGLLDKWIHNFRNYDIKWIKQKSGQVMGSLTDQQQ